MKKTYIIPVTEMNPLFMEGNLLQATNTGLNGVIDDGGSWGNEGGEGGPTIPADANYLKLWDEDE